MDKCDASNFLPNIGLHNTLSICSRMASWGTWDPRRVLGFHCLIGSRVVLI